MFTHKNPVEPFLGAKRGGILFMKFNMRAQKVDFGLQGISNRLE